MPIAQTMPFTEQEFRADSDVGRALIWLRDAENSTPETEWRHTSAEDYRFYAGEQDTWEVRSELERQRRPNTKFNEIKPKIDALVGMAAQVRNDTTVVPVNDVDEPFSELMAGVLSHYRRNMKQTRLELDCFEHTVKSGRSYMYFYVDTSNPFKPKICSKRLRGYNCFPDPMGSEYDGSDWRYFFLDKWMSEDDFKRYYPSFDINQLQSFSYGYSNPYGEAYNDLPRFFNEARDLYRIVEGWYYKYMQVMYFVNPMSGKVEDLLPEQFAEFLGTLDKFNQQGGVPTENGLVKIDPNGIKGELGWKKVPHYMIFSGTYVFEQGPSQLHWPSFPVIQYGAYRNEDNNSWFGSVTMMKDPQRAINTMMRQLQHLLQTLPKGILAHEVGAILNIEEYEERSADPSFHMEIAKGMIEKYKFEKQPAISPVYERFYDMAGAALKNTGGVQDALLGIQTSSREPGVTQRQHHETNVAVLYILYSNFQESRHNSTRLLLSLIQQFCALPEVIRIEGEKGMELLTVNTQLNRQLQGFNDVSAMEFDLAVEDTAETATMRMATAALLQEYNHNNPESIPPDILLEYADVPFSVKQRVKENWQQQQQIKMQQSQENAKKLELERDKAEAEIELKWAEIDLKKQELALRQLEIETNHHVKHEGNMIKMKSAQSSEKREREGGGSKVANPNKSGRQQLRRVK